MGKIAYIGSVLMVGLVSPALSQPAYNWNWHDADATERVGYSCAALMMILTDTPNATEPAGLPMFATQAGQLMADIAAAQTASRLNEKITNGFVQSVRDREMRVWAANWDAKDHGFTVGWAGDCIGWVQDISVAIRGGKVSGPLDVVYQGPYEPKRWTGENLESAVGAAFAAWYSSGRVTAEDMKEMLRREVH